MKKNLLSHFLFRKFSTMQHSVQLRTCLYYISYTVSWQQNTRDALCGKNILVCKQQHEIKQEGGKATKNKQNPVCK